MSKHEPEHGQSREVDLVAVSPKGDVVAEPGRNLRGVGHATDPGQGGHVVKSPTFLRLDTQLFTQPRRDGPGSEHMLHRLAQAQVRGQRKCSEQLSEPKARVEFARFHGHRLRSRLPSLLDCWFVG